jgi:hypothetical protein
MQDHEISASILAFFWRSVFGLFLVPFLSLKEPDMNRTDALSALSLTVVCYYVKRYLRLRETCTTSSEEMCGAGRLRCTGQTP